MVYITRMCAREWLVQCGWNGLQIYEIVHLTFKYLYVRHSQERLCHVLLPWVDTADEFGQSFVCEGQQTLTSSVSKTRRDSCPSRSLAICLLRTYELLFIRNITLYAW